MASEKNLAVKKQQVSELAQEFREAETLVIAQYGGLTVADDTAMRADMRANDVNYKVVKNRLALRAAHEAGFGELEDLFVGRTAIAYSKDDVVAPARLIKKYADQHKEMEIKGGLMEGAVAPLEQLQRLASIPDRETLIARVVGGIAAPLSGLAIFLNAIREKMEEAGAETAADVYEGAAASDEADVETAETDEAPEAETSEDAAPADGES